jgi:hypothetical protein
MCYGRELEMRVNHVWLQHFEKFAKHATIKMAKNSMSIPVDFRLADIVTQKFWMLAFKKCAFDDILGFQTEGLQNADQDLYREITSYTWSEMNDATRDALEGIHGFVGREHVQSEEDGRAVPVTRADLALRKLANNIDRKPLEIVSKLQFKRYLQSDRFLKKRMEWSKRVEALRSKPKVVVGVPQTLTAHARACDFDAAHLARVAASAASSAAAKTSTSVSVAVAVASSAQAPVPPQSSPPHEVAPLTEVEKKLLLEAGRFGSNDMEKWNAVCDSAKAARNGKYPSDWSELVYAGKLFADARKTLVPPPPLTIFPLNKESLAPPPPPPPPSVDVPTNTAAEQAEIEAERSVYNNPSAGVGSETDDVIEQAIDEEMLEREFAATREWANHNVSPTRTPATRTIISGFKFYAKCRVTANAKTNGQRDLYCSIERGSKAERLCALAGIPIKKSTDRLLRSKKDIERFWKKVIDSGIDVSSVE